MSHLSELLKEGTVFLSLAEREDHHELLIRFDFNGKATSLTKKILLQKQRVELSKLDLLDLEIKEGVAAIYHTIRIKENHEKDV